MNKLLVFSFFLISFSAFNQENYQVKIDLINVSNDQVSVTIRLPKIAEDEAEYHMAKIVPGTYSISDFGRFITDFRVLDSLGNDLTFEKISVNRWQIKEAQKAHAINYKVHDSFDYFEGYSSNVLFEPGGTNIEADRNVFVINTFGFIGYLQGYKSRPYTLQVLHPSDIEGATALEKVNGNDTLDTFVAKDFNFLADGPLMYCAPDIVTRQLANAEVLVSVYSPNAQLSASEVMEKIADLMEAQSEYLGGELPVDRYAYLIYLMDKPSLSGSMGALEHSYSSVYTLPETNAENIGQTVRDVAAHEFFHIVTPLNIHSEQIGSFDYIDPKMSKHLWLYEGCTEYASMHVQVKHGLYSIEKFLDEVKSKIQVRDQFPTDIPFTEMSQRILEPDYEPLYTNVYFKGALIGMCLDLLLIKLSEGTYDLQSLMRELAKRYGPNKSFEDDQLFEEITSITYPEVADFFEQYVDGKESLPIQEYLSWAGIKYAPFEEYEDFTLGNIGLGVNEDQKIFISNTRDMNEFGESMGYLEGDVIESLNGRKVTLENAAEVFDNYSEGLEVGDKIKMVILRDEQGTFQKKNLKGKATKIVKKERHILRLIHEATPEQMIVRNSWLGTN